MVKFDCFDQEGEEEQKERSELGTASAVCYKYSLASDKTTLVTTYSGMFQFEVFLCPQYPFSPPQVTCLTRFTSHIDLYDGRDLYADITRGEDYRVAKNLYEVILAIPEFIEATK